jgi:drug/metabolite transporter (DMT)-like permease
MILAATLLWAAEVILAKRLLDSIAVRTLAVARMGLGTLILLGWVALSGRGGELAHLTADQWRWAILTGLFLSAYVATWYAALARAQAVDVTAVLVFGAVVTAVLSRAADGVAFDGLGVVLVTLGAALAAVAGRQARARTA